MRGDVVGKEEFSDVLARYIPADSKFYNNSVRIYDILETLAEPVDLPEVRIHGISMVPSGDSSTTQDLEHCILNNRPEQIRSIHDPETLVYLHMNRGNELATIVDENGYLSQVGGAFLPGDPIKYARQFGKLSQAQLGHDESEDPGARHYSGICASAEIKNGLVMVLSKKGEISTFMHGYMIHNSKGRLPYHNLETPERASMMRPPVPAQEAAFGGRPRMPEEEYLRPPEPASASIEQ